MDASNTNKYNIHWIWELFLIVIISQLGGCKKFVEIPASPSLVSDGNVYTTDASSISVLTGIYTDMSKPSFGQGIGSFTGLGSISLMAGLSADELTLFSGVTANNYISYYQNKLNPFPNVGTASGSEYWKVLYNYIYRCNAALEGLSSDEAEALTPSIREQLIGEAKFLRAFFYSYLFHLYGDIPIILTTDYKVNAQLARSSNEDIYKQIIADLQDAENLLSDNFLSGTLLSSTSDRVRPTKWAAAALLARTYLYSGNYQDAEAQATTVINNAAAFSLTDSLNNVFLKNSKEAIWQLQPVTFGHNTEDGWIFNLPASGPSDIAGVSVNPAYISPQLLNSFEANDWRKTHWVRSIVSSTDGKTYYYPYKYKSAHNGDPVTEYLMVLRLAEQYLIRAEARVHLGDLPGAAVDLNSIRSRAGLTAYSGPASQAPLLSAILHERQVELFTEWGHRWFDLKRTKNIDAVMNVVTPLKANGVGWQTNQQLYPLPKDDLDKDLNLIQNSGY